MEQNIQNLVNQIKNEINSIHSIIDPTISSKVSSALYSLQRLENMLKETDKKK